MVKWALTQCTSSHLFCLGLTWTSFKFKCFVLTADGHNESFIQFTVTAKEIS